MFFTLAVLLSMMPAVQAAGGSGKSEGNSCSAFLKEIRTVLAEENEEINKTLEAMTDEEKILQLFVVDPEELDRSVPAVTETGDNLKNTLKRYPVGGVIFFADNLKTPKQTRKMLTSMNRFYMEETGLPLLLCVDEEGGRVARVSQNDAFGREKTGAMNTIKTPEEARKAGSYIGAYLYMLGFNMNLAPVADVITVSGNTSIGDRSFGTDPVRVTELAGAYSDGLHASGIMSTFKHFPGDGATASDTHQGFA